MMNNPIDARVGRFTKAHAFLDSEE
jgi:hypothetical protein